jgi:hypothetical protein
MFADGWAVFGVVLLLGIVGWAASGRFRQIGIARKLWKFVGVVGGLLLLVSAAVGAGR